MIYAFRAFIPALFAAAMTVQAQPYPVKPIGCVVPYPAARPTDIIGRAIGSEQVARSSADGYTLLWGTPGTHPRIKRSAQPDS